MNQDWKSRSVFIDNWKISISIAIISILIFRLIERIWKRKFTKKESKTVDLIQLSESEYVREYENEVENDDDDLKPALNVENHIPFTGAKYFLSGGIDEFYKIAHDRRSVRKFSKKTVNYDIIEKCILAAGTSPSGAHTEPWTFCVIENQSIKEHIRYIV